MARTSYWRETAGLNQYPALDEDITVDVLVIGGGITGLTAAYLLSQAGQNVALLERDRVAGGDSGRTTAHLTCVMDTRLTELAKTFGDDGARTLWEAGQTAINQMDQIANQCGVGCELASVNGFLYLADPEDEAGLQELHNEVETAKRLGISAEFVEKTPYFWTPGIRFSNQARFHPTRYMQSLLKNMERAGCKVYEHSNADEFADDGKLIRVGKSAVRAGKTVIATHTPLMGHSGLLDATLLQTKLYLYTSYVVCAEVPKRSIPDCLFWDTGDPYSYLRLQPEEDADIVIYGGRDHKTGQVEDTEGVFASLEEDLHRVFATRGVPGKITGRWSGQVVETNDGAPYIGETAENQFAASGFSGNGLTFGTLAGMMAADWAQGRQVDQMTELLSPSRKKIVGGTLEYIKENVDFPYYMVRDRLREAEGTSLSEVKPGEGGVVNIEGERTAVYRDQAGELHELSPHCTHLGCFVQWNGAESTWDCPCHGSRFHPTGEVMGGPAESPLERKKKLAHPIR